ncbi:Transglutaminase-like enzyme, putative cysteine protease [Methylobacterium sp. UNC378MF]|uniref:transglutaminase family protein n=1 Tax=Methylobacterium sp. UNC378MF TaxID=1502748 RepID=UPI0008925630|nr:transglutaminase family protein [Methylobacterium sp. UNC378MF]SDA30715.1 Transglutaminase-like enzyme, putative cysteine protease [Methylobacterium sp. UNC378MF]
MPILSVRHRTVYRYRRPVAFGEHRIMFRPRDSYDQRLIAATLDIAPEPASLRWLFDVFGNCVAVTTFDTRAETLTFACGITLDHTPEHAPVFPLAPHATHYPFGYGAEDMPDLARSIERQWPDPHHEVDAWARSFLPPQGRIPTQELLAAMTRSVRANFTYLARSEKGVQDPLTTLRTKLGSCRDFAVLMMEGVRALGMAARFVSGYLYNPRNDRARHVGGGSTHAWLQVYLPGAGWVEFDPTNGIVGNRDLIRVAVTRDPAQAVPLHGSFFGLGSDDLGMRVDVDVVELTADGVTAHSAQGPPTPPVR